jgi:hypothetical protein
MTRDRFRQRLRDSPPLKLLYATQKIRHGIREGRHTPVTIPKNRPHIPTDHGQLVPTHNRLPSKTASTPKLTHHLLMLDNISYVNQEE